MEQTECSETLAYKLQTPGNYPEESIQHLENGKSLKSGILIPVVSQFSDVTAHLSYQFKMHGMNNMKISKLLFDYILHS
jgi:hypothetical protein